LGKGSDVLAYTELIKNFNKVRDYMRDFYIYGFKVRGDFTSKSARTYDDEKRRIESYLAPYIRWENDKKGKRVYVSLDTSYIESNPLYNAWKAKSFTDNDITLHFAILSALRDGPKNITDLTDSVCSQTGAIFETQTVRIKANEYVKEGLLLKENQKKTDYYTLSPITISMLPVEKDRLLDAVRYFQEVAPLGFVGSTILDQEREKGDSVFGFKHHYIVHTLEDGVLLDMLHAMKNKCRVSYTQQSTRLDKEKVQSGIPLQIFVSVQSGRRYVCLYSERSRRFHNCRLDYIKKVSLLDEFAGYEDLRQKLEKAKTYCWGVSFGGAERKQILRMKLHIDEEKEGYVLERLKREGRGGEISHVGKDTYFYTKELFDATEMMAWVKSFTGRILSLEGTNREAIDYFYRDMERMSKMYGGDE
jgi:hypothetical protein